MTRPRIQNQSFYFMLVLLIAAVTSSLVYFRVKHFNFFQVDKLFILADCLFVNYFNITNVRAILEFDIYLIAILLKIINFLEIILDFISPILKFLILIS